MSPLTRAVASLVGVVMVSSLGVARAAEPTTADCLAANEDAIALRRQQKLRAARDKLLICSATSCPGDVRNECTLRVAAINAALPTVVFEAKDPLGNDLGGVKVTMDGQLLAARLVGTALSVDPGEHSFVFEAAGAPAVTKTFVIHEAEKERHERIVIGASVAPLGLTPPSPGRAVPSRPLPPLPAPGPDERPHGLGAERTLAIVGAGIGVVGVAAGTLFGLQAKSKGDDAARACPSHQCTSQQGLDTWDDAHSAATLSTVAFAVGGVGLAAGAVLWLSAPPSTSDAPTAQVSVGLGTLRLTGTW